MFYSLVSIVTDNYFVVNLQTDVNVDIESLILSILKVLNVPSPPVLNFEIDGIFLHPSITDVSNN